MQENEDQVFEFQGKKYKFDTSGREATVGDIVMVKEPPEWKFIFNKGHVGVVTDSWDNAELIGVDNLQTHEDSMHQYRVKVLQEVSEEVTEPKKYAHPLGEILVAIAEGRDVEFWDYGRWSPFNPCYDVIDFEAESDSSLWRIAQPKPIELLHYLIYTKGSFRVTKKKYASEEDVQKGYSYKVKVIHKIEEGVEE
jgi:hypothetical protein